MANVPELAFVNDIKASHHDPNTVFVALDNHKSGDFAPYLVKSTDRGRTWTSITGNLPQLHDVWSVIQDHENRDLLFAGTEFGVFATFDGGREWHQLRGGLPPAQVRDMAVQRRESDLVLGTFGRGFYVLDDYGPLREMSAETLSSDAHLFPLRNVHQFNTTGSAPAGSASISNLAGNFTTPNPPYGAVFTYLVNVDAEEEETLVLLIKDGAGELVREMEMDSSAGLQRVAWDLRADPPEADESAGGDEGPAAARRPQGRSQRGPLVDPGRYQAILGWKVGEDIVEVGEARSFQVIGVQW